jgi:hypothetical protein
MKDAPDTEVFLNRMGQSLMEARRCDSCGRPVNPKVLRQPDGANESRLVEIESRFGASLPDTFRKFLQAVNGGEPRYNINPDSLDIEDDEVLYVRMFWGTNWLSPLSDPMTLEDNNVNILRRPCKLMNFAFDRMGNLYSMALEGNMRGAIYLPNDNLINEDAPISDYSICAKDFVSFGMKYLLMWERYGDQLCL